MTNSTDNQKIKKSKGPIRTGAVVPFIVVVALVWAYFFFFFDHNLRKGIEWLGYQVVGAEVDIGYLKTSFWNADIQIKDIEVTNADKPTHDIFKVGDVRFGVLWDGLLRARVIINEMAVENIEIDVERKHVGKVKPPEPKATGPSATEQAADKFKNEALNKVSKDYEGNVLGDIASLLKGTSSTAELSKVQNTLESKKLIDQFQADLKEAEKKWNERLATLPQGKEMQDLSDRLAKVQTKDFKTPQDVQASVQQITQIFKDADSKYKTISSAAGDLQGDLTKYNQELNQINDAVKKDVANIQQHFKIPDIDSKSLAKSLLYQYFAPYLGKFEKYQDLAKKYMPPNLLNKSAKNSENQVEPHPRAKGVTYEFTNTHSYPMFWIKRVAISSKATPGTNYGDVSGMITDITSNQKLVGQPTVADIKGEFPSMDVHAGELKLSLDNREETSRVDYFLSVGSYGVKGKDILKTDEATIGFNKATGHMNVSGNLIGLREFSVNLNNSFIDVDYNIVSKEQVLTDILKDSFAAVKVVNIQATGHGELPGIDLDVNSNFGDELSKNLAKQVQKKIDDFKLQIQNYVNNVIGPEKQKAEAQLNGFKTQYDSQIEKVKSQADGEKKDATNKLSSTQQDAVNQQKQKVEDEIKKHLDKDGQKTIDDLKKKFGF